MLFEALCSLAQAQLKIRKNVAIDGVGIELEEFHLFDQTEFPVSDAAKVAFEIGKEYLVKPDWKRAFEADELKKTVQRMIRPE